jgi:hypothetical protein
MEVLAKDWETCLGCWMSSEMETLRVKPLDESERDWGYLKGQWEVNYWDSLSGWPRDSMRETW